VLGLKFRRQHVLHGFIVDFYCAAERIVVELEGDVHDAPERVSYDDARAAFLEAAGYRRFVSETATHARATGGIGSRTGYRPQPPFPLSPKERGQGVRTNDGRGGRGRTDEGKPQG